MKRLVFCFDGTWNRLDAPHSTNVVITAESVVPIASDGTAQLIYYDEGVGTGGWERVRGGVFGMGLVQNLADAYRFLIFNYSPSDEIYIFGFSRGAYTARSFAGLLRTCGILRRKDAGLAKVAIEHYQSRDATSDAFQTKIRDFRAKHSGDVVVTAEEEAWRCQNVAGYRAGSACRLEIAYLGVWDTVGALGVPASFFRFAGFASGLNKKHQFHDTSLSPFVHSARHAVAIDERRVDFGPTLWDNVDELNGARGIDTESHEAPYQQKWFPGTHGSVGGGGSRRGLSDIALDWVLDGARLVGLELDGSEHSRIFELAPDPREHLENELYERKFFKIPYIRGDRLPGPTRLHEVSIGARRRWLTPAGNLAERTAYQPATLANVAGVLKALSPADYGVGADEVLQSTIQEIYRVQRGDTLSAIAQRLCGHANKAQAIFDANRDKLENPDRIHPGQTLRIPKT